MYICYARIYVQLCVLHCLSFYEIIGGKLAQFNKSIWGCFFSMSLFVTEMNGLGFEFQFQFEFGSFFWLLFG